MEIVGKKKLGFIFEISDSGQFRTLLLTYRLLWVPSCRDLGAEKFSVLFTIVELNNENDIPVESSVFYSEQYAVLCVRHFPLSSLFFSFHCMQLAREYSWHTPLFGKWFGFFSKTPPPISMNSGMYIILVYRTTYISDLETVCLWTKFQETNNSNSWKRNWYHENYSISSSSFFVYVALYPIFREFIANNLEKFHRFLLRMIKLSFFLF